MAKAIHTAWVSIVIGHHVQGLDSALPKPVPVYALLPIQYHSISAQYLYHVPLYLRLDRQLLLGITASSRLERLNTCADRIQSY